MGTPVDTYVQVAADGSGKKIRNQQVYVLDATGTPVPVYEQAVAIVDDRGNIVNSNLQPVLSDILDVQREILTLMRQPHGELETPTDRGPIASLWAQAGLPAPVGVMNAARGISDTFGRQITIPQAPRDLIGTQTTTISASTSETTIITAAPGFNDVVLLVVSNTSAATSTRIDFRDSTTGTILFSLQSVGGAAPVGFALPVPLPQTNRASNWTAQCATSTTDIRIYAVYIKNR